MSRAKWVQMVVAVFAASFILGGCATMKGLGEDIETAGEKIQEAADKD